MMRKVHVLAWLLLALLADRVQAQGVQNSDIAFLFGATRETSQTLGGPPAATISAGANFAMSTVYGYQIVRQSAASLWVDVALAWGNGVATAPGLDGSASCSWSAYTPGLRFMVPAHERVSFFGVAGGGAGRFYAARVTADTAPSLRSSSTWHGVMEIGGGVDFRLRRSLSIRLDTRDFITGRGLGAVEGRHHPIFTVGIALHH